MEQLLASRQPLLIFLEEPPGVRGPRLSALGLSWLGLVVQGVQAGIVPDTLLVPVAVTYDLVPEAPHDTCHVRPSCPGSPSGYHLQRGGTVLYPVTEAPRGWGSGGSAKQFHPYGHYPVAPTKAVTVIFSFHSQKTLLGKDFSCFTDKNKPGEVMVMCQVEPKMK